MRDFSGKVAFITGGASGIGLGIARALALAGAKVALADVRAAAVEEAAASIQSLGGQAMALVLDVADRAAWACVAARVERELGAVQILCSNAGVNFVGATQDATYEDWDFALDINLGGAINAVRTFVPRIISHGNGGHIVITSSVSGLFTGGGAGVYVTTKFALVGLAESLRADLKSQGIGVSVLLPGPVQSQLFETSVIVRPQSLAATGSVPIVPAGVDRETTAIYQTAPNADDVGKRVVHGIEHNDLYIMTHPEIRPVLEARARALIGALPTEPADPGRIEASRLLLDTSLYTS